jgi:L-ascorbate metabolism protein UlaG (beta-lactamase superfamily)
VGHGTVLIEMDGLRILTDPVLKRWVGPLRRYGALPDPTIHHGIDVVLISHQHLDHLEPGSLRLLPKSAVVIGPPLTGGTVHKVGFKTVVETRRDTALHLGDLEIVAVHARHTRRRWILSSPTEPLGFLIHGSSTIYFAGDTGLFDGMDELHERIDLALLPIETWGMRPAQGRHLTPRTAAHALSLLQPRFAVPIHWGTLYLPGSAYAGKEATYAWFQRTRKRPEEFAALAAEMAPDVDVRLLAPGESIAIEAARPELASMLEDAPTPALGRRGPAHAAAPGQAHEDEPGPAHEGSLVPARDGSVPPIRHG